MVDVAGIEPATPCLQSRKLNLSNLAGADATRSMMTLVTNRGKTFPVTRARIVDLSNLAVECGVEHALRSESQSRQGSRSVDVCRNTSFAPAFCIGGTRRF